MNKKIALTMFSGSSFIWKPGMLIDAKPDSSRQLRNLASPVNSRLVLSPPDLYGLRRFIAFFI